MTGRKTWHYKAAGDSVAEMQVLYSEGDHRQGVPFFEDDVNILLKGVVVDEIESIGAEMKGVDEAWDCAFGRMQFESRHQKIMGNTNVLYECRDARDDFAAQRRLDGAIALNVVVVP